MSKYKYGSYSENLLKCADLAMYCAKRQGKNGYYLLHYQPIIDIQTHLIIGTEALVRWNHPEFGVILPEEFIPIAEANGFIIELGQ